MDFDQVQGIPLRMALDYNEWTQELYVKLIPDHEASNDASSVRVRVRLSDVWDVVERALRAHDARGGLFITVGNALGGVPDSLWQAFISRLNVTQLFDRYPHIADALIDRVVAAFDDDGSALSALAERSYRAWLRDND